MEETPQTPTEEPQSDPEEKAPEAEKILTMEEAMERLSLGRALVYRKVMDGALKAVKTDHALTFTEPEIEKYEADTTAKQTALSEALDRWLGTFADRLKALEDAELPDMSEKNDADRTAELVRRIVLDGILSGVNDIHLDPLYAGDRLLYRFEGNLREIGRLEACVSELLKPKLRGLAPLPAATPEKVGEALFQQAHGDRAYQIRLTAIPTLLGEQVHLHFFDRDPIPTIAEAGYTPDQATALQAMLTGRPGLFLTVGASDPEADRHRLVLADGLSASGRLVVSLEHRIQYRSELLVQLEIGREGAPGFQALWQSAIGMSPDAILMDDVRDAQEAKALIEAVSAGAVVVAQMRASGGPEAILQLIRFELDRDGLARALLGLVERASLRRLCPHCRVARAVVSEEADRLGIPDTAQLYESPGCDACDDGFLGRRALYGLLQMDGELADLVRSADIPAAALEAWREKGALSLPAAVRAALLNGEISPEDAGAFLRP